MAKYDMAVGPGFNINLQYNAGTGKVTALQVVNNTGGDVYAEADLSNGQVFGQVFGPGTTSINIPNNLVTIAFDANGDVTFGGLDAIQTRIPAAPKPKSSGD